MSEHIENRDVANERAMKRDFVFTAFTLPF